MHRHSSPVLIYAASTLSVLTLLAILIWQLGWKVLLVLAVALALFAVVSAARLYRIEQASRRKTTNLF